MLAVSPATPFWEIQDAKCLGWGRPPGSWTCCFQPCSLSNRTSGSLPSLEVLHQLAALHPSTYQGIWELGLGVLRFFWLVSAS